MVKLPAPAYWSRWEVPGYGVVERSGGFAAWTALGTDGQIVGYMLPTRKAAVEKLICA